MQKTISFDPKWLVLGGLMLVYAASNGVIVHTLPLLYPKLIGEFGWTTMQMTLPATAFMIFGAITSPPAGILFDRFSPRILIMCGSGGIVVSLVLYSFVTELWHMVAVYLLFGLSLSFSGLTAMMVVLTRWFDKLRGRAIGLLLMSSSFGGAVFPLLLGLGTEQYGWRMALVIVAAGALALTFVPLWLMIRDRPTSAPTGTKTGLITYGGPTLRSALRNPTFYLLALATGSMWFAIVALLQHQSIYLVRDVGIGQATLPIVFSVFFSCSIIGKFAFGWLGDLIDNDLALIASICTFAASLVVVRQMSPESSAMLYSYAILAGIGFSGVFTTIQLSIAGHFAGGSYGKILAILVMIDSLAGGLGTAVIANIRDQSGSYVFGFNLLLGLCVFAAISVGAIGFRKWRTQPYVSERATL